MGGIVVTGIGIASPPGLGREAFADAVALGRAPAAFRVPDFPLEEFLDDARPFRRVAQAARFALAAVSGALADAGLPRDPASSGRAGLVLGVTHGAMTYSTHFHRGLLQEGPAGASPLHFSESVLNAPAGNASIAFGIRGPVHTLVGEETVGGQAVALAVALLREGSVDRCVVAGTEEWSDVVAAAYAAVDRAARGPGRDAPPELGEGAAALVLETEGQAARRGAAVRARVSPPAFGRLGPREDGEAAARVVLAAFAHAGAAPAEADHVVLPTGRRRADAERGAGIALGAAWARARRIDLRPIVGNPAGASFVFETAASALSLSPGRAGLVLSTGIDGTLGAMVLSHPVRRATP